MSFYFFNNFISKQNYLFIGPTNEITSKLITKLIKNTILPTEYEELRTYYKLPKKLDENIIVYNYDINSYTIKDIKNLLFVLLDIPPQLLHLWVYTNASNELENGIISRLNKDEKTIDIDFTKLPITLGFMYKNEYGINYYNGNILDSNVSNVSKDNSDEYIDLHSNILETNNIIYFVDYNTFKSIANTVNLDLITEIYFPNLKNVDVDESKINKAEFKVIYRELNENIIEYNSVYNDKIKDKFSIKFENSEFSNLIMYINTNFYKEIRLEEIYNLLEPLKNIVFIK